MMDKLCVLAKCTAVATLMFGLVACKPEVPAKPVKVLQSTEGSCEKELKGIVIRSIKPDGTVLIGSPGSTIHDCEIVALSLKRVYALEGKAMVGDPAILIIHYEDQILENGQVKRVVTKWGVRSRYNKELERHFSTPTAGDNQLGTK